MTVHELGARSSTVHDDPTAFDPLRDELVDMLAAAASLDGGEGPRPHVWEQIEAAISERPQAVDAPTPPTPIARRRVARTRRTIVRVVAIAAAIATLGGVAYATLPLDADESSPARPTPTPTVTDEVATVEQAARRASDQDGARVVTLTSGDGRSSVELVVLPDGTGYVLASELPLGDAPYWLYAIVGDVRVLLSAVHDSTAVRLAKIPAGAALLVLIDDVGAVVAGAPLVAEVTDVAPPELPPPDPQPRGPEPAPRPSPAGSEVSSGPAPAPAPPAPFTPGPPPPLSPDDERPLLEIELPSLLRGLLSG